MATEASERKNPVNACCVVNEQGGIHDNAYACIILPLLCGTSQMFVVWFFGFRPLARALVALARAVAVTWSFLASAKMFHFNKCVFVAMVSMALTILGDLSQMQPLM